MKYSILQLIPFGLVMRRLTTMKSRLQFSLFCIAYLISKLQQRRKPLNCFQCNWILAVHPHLHGIVSACIDHPDTFGNLIHMVSQYMHTYMQYLLMAINLEVEHAAAGSMRRWHCKAPWWNFDIHVQRPKPTNCGFNEVLQQDPLIPGSAKSLRGWNYIETAYLLCPEQCLEEFLSDPE